MKLLTRIIGISICAVSISSFASMQQCAEAGVNQNYQNLVKYCKSYADSNINATGLLGAGYSGLRKYKTAVKYLQKSAKYYNNNSIPNDENSKLGIAAIYATLGNIYYFALGDVSKNTTKGLEYITKGAELGNPTAQSQLGNIYAMNDAPVPKNFPLSYKWYYIASQNGDSQALSDSYVNQHLSVFKDKFPYCISLGQDNVAQAYYQGIGGLNKSTSTAVTWLEKAHDSDPSLSIINLDLAKMQHNNGNDSAAFKAASNAVSQPYAPAFQYLGTMFLEGTGTSKDMVKAYAYLKVAEYYYNNPDKAFWEKFKAPCRPNYAQIPSGFGLGVLKQELGKIELNAEQKTQAEKIIEEIKGKVEAS
jgi:TPR repeat protein